MSEGYLDMSRAVASIRVGRRIRQELGDLDELVESIRENGGLLQPITITPDGWLICGARRLAAVQRLGLQTVSVWVRTGISTPLQLLLAEQHENAIRKPLTLVEAARRYQELLAYYSEDASRRQEATRLHGNDRTRRGAGAANFAAPAGRARVQAAAVVGYSHTTLTKVGDVMALAEDESVDPSLRELAAQRRDLMEATGKADGHYRAVMSAKEQAEGTAAGALARAKAARARPAARKERGERVPPVAPARRPVLAFLVMLRDTDYWWMYYDPQELADKLTAEQWELLEDWQASTDTFLAETRRLRRASA